MTKELRYVFGNDMVFGGMIVRERLQWEISFSKCPVGRGAEFPNLAGRPEQHVGPGRISSQDCEGRIRYGWCTAFG